jgi:hypothetical protein
MGWSKRSSCFGRRRRMYSSSGTWASALPLTYRNAFSQSVETASLTARKEARLLTLTVSFLRTFRVLLFDSLPCWQQRLDV